MSEDVAQPLFQLIKKLLPLLEQFLRVLKDEKEALVQLNADQLIKLTHEKNALLDQIYPLSQALQAHIPPEQSLKAALTDPKHAEEDKKLLKQFIKTSEAAEKLHLENGATLMRTAQINEGILRVLLGREDSPTYHEKITGKGTRSAGKVLGKA